MRQPKQKVSPEWIASIKDHVYADFENGHLYWKHPGRGKVLFRPIGCKDSNGYIKVSINLVSIYVHIVMYYLYYGIWPTSLIDHKDRNPSNNKPDNLVLSNHSDNALNSGVWASNTTGVKGVSWSQASSKYKVTKCGKHLGYFENLQFAKQAYENG